MKLFVTTNSFEKWIQGIPLSNSLFCQTALIEDEIGIWEWTEIFQRRGLWRQKLIYEVTSNSILVHGRKNLEYAQYLVTQFYNIGHTTVSIEVIECD